MADLKVIRNKIGFNQSEMSRFLGISHSSIQRIETGESSVSVELVRWALEFLDENKDNKEMLTRIRKAGSIKEFWV